MTRMRMLISLSASTQVHQLAGEVHALLHQRQVLVLHTDTHRRARTPTAAEDNRLRPYRRNSIMRTHKITDR